MFKMYSYFVGTFKKERSAERLEILLDFKQQVTYAAGILLRLIRGTTTTETKSPLMLELLKHTRFEDEFAP